MAAQTYTLACPATIETTTSILLEDNEVSTGYDATNDMLVMNMAEVMACFEIGMKKIYYVVHAPKLAKICRELPKISITCSRK